MPKAHRNNALKAPQRLVLSVLVFSGVLFASLPVWACTDNAECDPDTCIEGACAPKSAQDGPCDAHDDGDCESGLECSGSGHCEIDSGTVGCLNNNGGLNTTLQYQQIVAAKFKDGLASNQPPLIVDIAKFDTTANRYLMKTISETHKSPKGTDLKTLTQIDEAIDDEYQQAIWIIATGTPRGVLSENGTTGAQVKAAAEAQFSHARDGVCVLVDGTYIR